MRDKLTQAGYDSPADTSLILLQHTLKQSKSWVLSHGEYQLTPQEQNTLQTVINKVKQGLPLPYILGYWDFFGRRFSVTPAVLIPRPETELLVELAIQHARLYIQPRIVDVGTGSGAIAVSLAAELPSAVVIGVDLSMAALRVAQGNSHQLSKSSVHFLQANLLAPCSAQFDLICANLPYIPSGTLSSLPVSRWEPRLALDGGVSGLDVIEKLLEQAQSRLSPTGVVLIEIESSLGAETLAIAQATFPNAQHRLIQDLAGHDRIVEIRQGINS